PENGRATPAVSFPQIRTPTSADIVEKPWPEPLAPRMNQTAAGSSSPAAPTRERPASVAPPRPPPREPLAPANAAPARRPSGQHFQGDTLAPPASPPSRRKQSPHRQGAPPRRSHPVAVPRP